MKLKTAANRSVLLVFGVAMSLGFLAGCVSPENGKNGFPYYGQSATVSVKVQRPFPAPPGSYSDQKRLISIKEDQKGAGFATLGGLLLGGVGGASLGAQLAYNASSSDAKKRYEAAINHLDVDVLAIANETIRKRLARADAPHWTADQSGHQLVIYPYVRIKASKDGSCRVWAETLVEVPDAAGKVIWTMDVVSGSDGLRPLEGPTGWMANGRMREALTSAFDMGFDLIIAAAEGRLNAARPMKATGSYPDLDTGSFTLPLDNVQELKDFIACRYGLTRYYILSREAFVFAQ
jgi:hypothetical protein